MMKTRRVSEETQREIALARRLSLVESIARLDDGEHEEGWALAHALSDIEESCKTLASSLIPTLHQEGLSDSEITDILFDIGEELRQLLYHVQNLKYYDYLPKDSEIT